MSDDASASGRADAAAAHALLDGLHDTITGATMQVVWRQWSALGGMTSAKQRARSLVDPEALVLISLTLREEEPRLADILADWATLNSDLLSVQRIRNLVERYPAETRDALHSFARVAFDDGKDHRWKPLLREGATPLARRINKSRAARAQPIEPAALVLRMRLAFGVGIKADALAFLLGTDEDAWAGANVIAAATGYTIAAVRRGIGDLVAARFVEKMSGTRSEYHAPRTEWQTLLGTRSLPPWRGWHERFVFVAAFLEWARDANQRPLSTYALESRGRTLLETHAAAYLWHRVWTARNGMIPAEDASALASAVRTLARWMVDEA